MTENKTKNLISLLQKLVEDYPEAAEKEVTLEGCDCSGTWDGGFEGDETGVYLSRIP